MVQWSIQSQGLFYNGLSIKEALQSPRNGLHSKRCSVLFVTREAHRNETDVCEKGGIVGRGILVDWVWPTILYDYKTQVQG